MPKQSASAENIPLRLRRRRDGSLALTDAEGRVGGDGRAFPASHVFTPTTSINLASAGAFNLSGDTITVTLCNAEASYKVTEQRANGEIVAELTKASLLDVPAIDQKAADKLAGANQEG